MRRAIRVFRHFFNVLIQFFSPFWQPLAGFICQFNAPCLQHICAYVTVAVLNNRKINNAPKVFTTTPTCLYVLQSILVRRCCYFYSLTLFTVMPERTAAFSKELRDVYIFLGKWINNEYTAFKSTLKKVCPQQHGLEVTLYWPTLVTQTPLTNLFYFCFPHILWGALDGFALKLKCPSFKVWKYGYSG